MNEENDGIKIFTDFANKYKNKIEDSNTAETFFGEFLNKTKGGVNIDCLDADNDDRIECVDFDHDKGMMRLCTRVPENDPEIRQMRKMAYPYDTYSFLIRFKNIHFIRINNGNCIAIVVNGYTMNQEMIESFVKKGKYTIKSYDEKSSFFTSNLVRTKNKLSEYIRAMKTPITSFWIIPKKLPISAYDSKKYLYLYNNEVLGERLENCLNKLSNQIGKTKDKEEIDDFIKMYGNQIRTVAEAFFKLVTCFYHDNLKNKKNKNKDYNLLRLGDLTKPLKKNVYTNTDDKSRLKTIALIANELSHDSGLPIKFEDIGELYINLIYYISDFKQKISSNDNMNKLNVPTKPSPKDYINQNLKKWNFKDTITQTVNNTSSCSCIYRLRIKDTDFKIMNFSNKNADYLCTDGYIKALKETDMSEALKVNSKENVIALIEAINNKVKSDCEAKGLDTEQAYLSWDIDIIRKSKPSHLFTFDEIKNLMANADDSKNNKLVIDENGYAHIITIPGPTYLYPVSIETWCAGNGYVGQNSSLIDAKPAYHLCLSLWLEYLDTDKKQYDDCHKQIDVDKTIEKIKEHY